jgi:hypothetical protein
MKWSIRVNARIWNLSDGYPSFGTGGSDENTDLEVPYPESLSRGHLLLKSFFGFIYCAIPHVFCLMFRIWWTSIILMIAWWVVLFTGKYPQSWHAFNVGTLRWLIRLQLYLGFMSDDYPRFSGKE